ncbi:hypothetical protein ACOICY_28860, partial [Klebsiella pneumoniae]
MFISYSFKRALPWLPFGIIAANTLLVPVGQADEAMEIIAVNGTRYQDDSVLALSHTGQSLTVISRDMIVSAG